VIVFLTSIRHPLNSNSYDRVLALLENTLRSIRAQSDPEWRAIVVCNERPERPFDDPRVVYLPVAFPPPSDVAHACIGMDALRLDRGCKYLVGLAHAARFAPDHVMFFDADDFVSNRVAAFANAHAAAAGWYIPQGYVYDEELALFGRLDNFHLICGTSHIVRYDALPMPEGVRDDATQEWILEHVAHRFLFETLGSHRWLVEDLAARGHVLEPMPFRAALYFIGNGENHTARIVATALWAGGEDQLEQLDLDEARAIRAEFALPAD
jgi:hypothetical protein